MAEIPLDKLKVGDRVIATQIGGNTSYTGTIAEIRMFPRYRGKTEVLIWLLRSEGKGRIGFNLTVEDTTPQWTFREDPAVAKEEKDAVLGLAHVARRKNLPEDVEGVIKGYVARKTGKARRSVRKQTRRRRVVRRLVRA
jgi:hypothetical protein